MTGRIAVFIVAVIGVTLSHCGRGVETIAADEARNQLVNDTTIVLLDVRTESEYRGEAGHLANALLIPFQDLEKRLGELTLYKGRTIIVYCRSGHRSANAAAFLAQHGFRVYNLEGGILRWNEAGYPVVKEQER